MTMKKYIFILLLCAIPGHILAGSGENVFSFLKISPSARASSMGDAFVAIADDASATYFNPAGMAHFYTSHLSLMHLEYLELTKYESLNYTHPLRRSGTVGFMLSYFNYGSMNIMKEDSSGILDPSGSGTFSSYDACISISYARFIIFDSLSAGISAKYIKQKIYTSSLAGSAVDAGILWKTPLSMLTYGLNVQHLGPSVSGYTLPSAVVTGIAVSLDTIQSNDLSIAFDTRIPLDGADAAYHIGAEHRLLNYLSLRLGYRAGYDIGTCTAGLSLELFGTKTIIMHLDYGYVPYDDFRDTHRVSLRAQFGRTK